MADKVEAPEPFKTVLAWFTATGRWMQRNIGGDPALAAEIRRDLGLRQGEDIPASKTDKLTSFAEGLDPEAVAFEDTIREALDLFEDVVGLLSTPEKNDWQVLYLMFTLAASGVMRRNVPWVWAPARLAHVVLDDDVGYDQFDPVRLLRLYKKDDGLFKDGEADAKRWMAFFGGLAFLGRFLMRGLRDKVVVEVYSGWDPDPDNTLAHLLAGTALTFLVQAPPDAGVVPKATLTFLPVPKVHQGPGFFLSLGGEIEASTTSGNTKYALGVNATGGLDMYVPLGGSTLPFTPHAAAPTLGFKLDVTSEPKKDEPALRIGRPGKSRFEIGALGFGVDIASDRAAASLLLKEAALTILLSQDGDGFLKQLPGDAIVAKFDLEMIADTANGIRFGNGTAARVTLPVNQSVFGAFSIYHLELALSPTPDDGLRIEAAGAFGVKLGPFRASIDQMGLQLDLGFPVTKDMKPGGVKFAFKPPAGVGLALDASFIKGGGYLYVDPVKGEYAGVLELKVGVVGIKAIGILSTKRPDGSDGWALLLLVFSQFPPIRLPWGFTLTGIGGIIGLHHSVNTDELVKGMSTGVYDDILFPADVVANAPRIINRLRVVFPYQEGALVVGLMVELSWATPSIVTLRLGLLVQLDNVPAGDRPISVGRIVLLGQLLVVLPPGATKQLAVLRLLVDVLGVVEFDPVRLGFVARLRDSKAGEVSLSGMLVVRAVLGDNGSFLLAAGGFHPNFKDIPEGTPAQIDRLKASLKIGPVRLTLQGYFAITAATIQAGAEVSAKAKVGPIELAASLGFDALCYLEPTFHFEVTIKATGSIKAFGKNLLGVGAEFTLYGPGRWRVTGKATFKILFWRKRVSFDESWGSEDPAPAVAAVSVVAELQAELKRPENWSAQLPAGGQALVTLGMIETDNLDEVLAHPLGQLAFTQRRVPLRLRVEKFGAAPVTAAVALDLRPTVNGAPAAAVRFTQEQFAVSQFVHMTDEDRLSQPSFQPCDAGVAFGTADYLVPAATEAGLEYETYYWTEPEHPWRRFRDATLVKGVGRETVGWMAGLAAAGRSPLRDSERVNALAAREVTISPPQLKAVDRESMAPVAGVELAGLASVSVLHAGQELAAKGELGTVQLVEAFELN